MGEAKRRKKTRGQAPWKAQIVLCYENEPYVAFDVTPSMLEMAITAENPPMTSDDAAYDWLIASLNQLREDVALIRDHSDELMLEPDRRDRMTCRAILMVQYLLSRKEQSLATTPAVIFNLLARQSSVEASSPGFQIAGLSEPLTVEEIRAMSTATHLYIQEGETIEKVPPPPSQRSKDRSKDRTCISIGAYWHNDQPGGVMIELNANLAEGQTSLDEEMNVLDQVVMSLAETRPSAKDTDEYLHYMAQQPGVRDGQTVEDRVARFQIMAAIAYAEEAGQIPSDDFNGMVYLYRVDENEFFIDRKDQPSKPS